eukprot:g17389.t1
MRKQNRRLANLNKTKKVEYRHILQDWDVWLSKQDNKGNDVNLHLENIYLDELQEDRLLLYERIKDKFKNPLVEPEQFYLQYKLSSEQYPINIELSQKAQTLAAFKKFAALKPLSLGILDEMMTLATGALKRAVYGIMPNEERQHHE